MGRRHGDGSFHGQEHSRDAGMDPEEFAGADWNGTDLPGFGESGREGRRPDMGNLPGHVARTMRAGSGLFYDSRGRAPSFYSADGAAHDGDREPGREHSGQMVPGASPGKLSLHALGRDLRNHGRI